MKDYENESDFVDSLIVYLSKYFTAEKEVHSDCDTGRIDIIFTCKQTGIRLGVECKIPARKKGQEIGEFIRQASYYSQLLFKGQKLPIFIAPQLSNSYLAGIEERKVFDGISYIKDRHPLEHPHHTVNGILGEFAVGEIRKIEGNYVYLAFIFSNFIIFSTHKKWDSDLRRFSNDIHGLNRDNYDNLMKKLNSWHTKKHTKI